MYIIKYVIIMEILELMIESVKVILGWNVHIECRKRCRNGRLKIEKYDTLWVLLYIFCSLLLALIMNGIITVYAYHEKVGSLI